MKSIFMNILTFVLIFAIVFTFSACDKNGKPEDTVAGLISALKDMDMEKAEQYINTGSLSAVNVDENLTDGDLIIEKVFSKLEYEIISVEKTDKNTAVVKTQITTPDLTKILWQCTLELTPQFAVEELGDEEQNIRLSKAFVEAINKEGQPTVTNEINIAVKRVDDLWKADIDNEFQNAISGGFLGAVANAQNTMFPTE